jgi:hypothetical protein
VCAQARLALARLHLDRDELEAARQQCTALLQMELASEAATLMLADIMLRSNEFDEAIRYFGAMIEHAPAAANYGPSQPPPAPRAARFAARQHRPNRPRRPPPLPQPRPGPAR